MAFTKIQETVEAFKSIPIGNQVGTASIGGVIVGAFLSILLIIIYVFAKENFVLCLLSILFTMLVLLYLDKKGKKKIQNSRHPFQGTRFHETLNAFKKESIITNAK